MILRRIYNIGIHLAAILVVLTMLAIVVNAGMRYLFGGGIHLVIELSGFFFLWIIFLSVAGTYLAGGHVTVELLTDAMPPKLRHLFSNIIMPVFGVVYVAMVGWAGLITTEDLYRSGETSIGTTRFLLWPAFAIMPIGCLMLVLALVYLFVRAVSSGPEPDKHEFPPVE